jgi:MerR family redox-sensitive transcriptional activator SoxR
MMGDPALRTQLRPGLLGEEEVGRVVAVQVADLAPVDLEANSPRLPVPASTPGQEVTSSVIWALALVVVVIVSSSISGTRFKIQVQVSLKSNPIHDLLAEMAELLTIGETAKRSGVAASALRFYEQRGLIVSASERAGSGHRRYPRPVLRRIAFIVFAQRVGLSLDEIGTELEKLPPNHAPKRRDWSRLSATWSSRIDERIAELERLKAGLTECIGCGCLSLDRCKLANPGDRAAGLGAGPRYWLGDRQPV